MQEVRAQAREAGKMNVAFLASFLLQDTDACIDILITSGRLPEATFFARTYRPSRAPELVKLWQEELRDVNTKAAESLASPDEYTNLFPDWEAALRVEGAQLAERNKTTAAAEYPRVEGAVSRDLLADAAAGVPHEVRFLSPDNCPLVFTFQPPWGTVYVLGCCPV
jgi:coatomer subunit beta'